MPDLRICYIADPQNPLPEMLRQRWEPFGVEWIPWQKGMTGQDTPFWLLFSPFRLGEYYQQPELVWKRFLQRERYCADVKLVVIGTESGRTSNYVDILDLPENPADLFVSARTISEKWERPEAFGMDMDEKLKKFFNGHGTESIRESFKTLRKSLKVNFDDLTSYPEDAAVVLGRLSDSDIYSKIQEFHARWERYFPLFGALPFFDIFVEMDAPVRQLALLKKSQPDEQHLAEWLQQALEAVDTIFKNILQLEEYVGHG